MGVTTLMTTGEPHSSFCSKPMREAPWRVADHIGRDGKAVDQVVYALDVES
jgi:hypothetical protein